MLNALCWPLPVGRAVRACRDVVWAGWLARQAIVIEGQEAGRAWESDVHSSGKGSLPGPEFREQCIRLAINIS
jgi:hypothetical protein